MTWTICQLILDSAMVCLIWVTHTIIYPSFKYMSDEQVAEWNPTYRKRMTRFVVPIMTLQLIAHGYEIFVNPGILPIIQLSIISLLWLITFWISLPMQENFAEAPASYRIKLLNTNKWRTLGWTLVWCMTLFRSLYFVI